MCRADRTTNTVAVGNSDGDCNLDHHGHQVHGHHHNILYAGADPAADHTTDPATDLVADADAD
jgi:hypothetical protein